MYSERDILDINRKLRKNRLILLPILVLILVVYIIGLRQGIEWLVMLTGPVLFIAACFGFIYYLLPNLRYRRFLLDMRTGLSRTLEGSIVSVADTPEPQDGAMVLPVHILLSKEQDERIVYLNASKRNLFPPPGTKVALSCYGRHIRDVEMV